MALHLWQRMLDKGLKQFGEVYYLGQLPAGPSGELLDCLVGIHGGVEIRFLFLPEDGELVGLDLIPADDADPCEIRFAGFRELSGRRLPTRWQVSHGDKTLPNCDVETWQTDNDHPFTTGGYQLIIPIKLSTIWPLYWSLVLVIKSPCCRDSTNRCDSHGTNQGRQDISVQVA